MCHFFVLINEIFLLFQDEDVGFQSSVAPKKKQYGPSADILQNIPNVDRVIKKNVFFSC
jgi:hypothetical protein